MSLEGCFLLTSFMSFKHGNMYKPSAEPHMYPVGDSVCKQLTGCWDPTPTVTGPSPHIPARDEKVKWVTFLPMKQLHQVTVDCQLRRGITTSALEYFKLRHKRKGLKEALCFESLNDPLPTPASCTL